MLNVSTFGNTADIYVIVHLVPHAYQHITVDQRHSSSDTVAKIWSLAGSGGTKTVSFTNPQKKKSHRVKSGDCGGHRINATSSFLVRPIHLCGKFRLRYPRTSLYWAGESSCWKMQSLLSLFNSGISQFSNMFHGLMNNPVLHKVGYISEWLKGVWEEFTALCVRSWERSSQRSGEIHSIIIYSSWKVTLKS